MKNLDEHPDLIWEPEDAKQTKYAVAFGGMFIIGWIVFLIMILAPSCPPHKTAEYYVDYGKHYMAQNDFTKAQIYFTKAISAKPDCYDAYIERINAYEQSDSIHKAIADYTTILSIFQLSVEKKGQLLYLRANDHYKILQDSAACKDWNDACELNIPKACNLLRTNCKTKK